MKTFVLNCQQLFFNPNPMKRTTAFVLSVFALGLFQTAFAQSQTPFPDVPIDSVNVDAIKYLKTNGVIGGFPDGFYKPKNNIKRAEFMKIVMEASADNLTGKNCFPDVHEEWFAPYVCSAKEKGIVEGHPDGNFKPADEINFSEATKIIVKAFGVQTGEDDSSTWYKKYVKGLEAEKAIPLSVEFFDEKITRDEMAEIAYRLKADVTNKVSRTYDEINGEGFVSVDSCDALKQRYDLRDIENYGYEGAHSMPFRGEEMEMPATMAPVPAETQNMDKAGLGGGGAADYSTTNIQVAGVDEADVIKNDGKYIYIIKGNSIRIVEAYPVENMKELVNVTFGSEKETYYPTEMYVDGDTLTVIGSASNYVTDPLAVEGEETSTSLVPRDYGSNRTKVYIVDITDRTKPKVERTVEFEANYNTSRRVGDNLYMIMNQYPYYYPVYYEKMMAPSTPTEPVEPSSIVPKMMDSIKGTDELVVPCNKVRLLPKDYNFNFVIAAAIPLNNKEKEVSREVLVGSSENIYASMNNLYVASTDWTGGYYKPYGSYGTAVYKFNLGDGTIAYKAKGKVPGTILNQFSMDEHMNNLRIATTENEFVMGSEINNNLYVLGPDMKVIGKVENIAPGEKIYSTRFVGDRGYMVTFKRVDPLFVLDLKEPTHPKLMGKLKIPGYSTYLHPYDENHLIGFGNEVDESIDADKVSSDDYIYYTAVQGLKLALFDVTDIDNPKEMFKEVIGDRGTYSDVLYNHKALLFDKSKNLLAFPVTVMEVPDEEACTNHTYSSCPSTCRKICVPSSCTYENGIKVCTPGCDGENSCVQQDVSYGETTFTGAYVYNLDLTNGFKLKGKVTHYDNEDMAYLEEHGYFEDYQKAIQRIIYIGDNLYTISQAVVKANALGDLTEKKMIELVGDAYDIYYGKPLM